MKIRGLVASQPTQEQNLINKRIEEEKSGPSKIEEEIMKSDIRAVRRRRG
jgi:hypothetical protein